MSMEAGTDLSAGLEAAYKATDYHVYPTADQAGFILRIGLKSGDLLALMTSRNANSAAYITACNPLGKHLSDLENRSRQMSLQQVLAQRSLSYWPGIGQGTGGDWPGEDSFLVLGLDLAAARRLASDFEQNAMVWAGADAVPQLVLLR